MVSDIAVVLISLRLCRIHTALCTGYPRERVCASRSQSKAAFRQQQESASLGRQKVLKGRLSAMSWLGRMLPSDCRRRSEHRRHPGLSSFQNSAMPTFAALAIASYSATLRLPLFAVQQVFHPATHSRTNKPCAGGPDITAQNLDCFAFARGDDIIADFRVHPSQLHTWFAASDQTVGRIQTQLVTRAFLVPGYNLFQPGQLVSTKARLPVAR